MAEEVTSGNEKLGLLHPTPHKMTFPAARVGESAAASYEFTDEFQGQGQKGLLDITSLKEPTASKDEASPPMEGGSWREKIEAMEPPKKQARTYQSLSQATIVLGVLCCCWPYTLFCLFGIFFLSKMVIYRNEERDYLSARTSSCILLGCNLFALIYGGAVTFTIFVVVFVYVIRALMNVDVNQITDGIGNLIPGFNDQ